MRRTGRGTGRSPSRGHGDAALTSVASNDRRSTVALQAAAATIRPDRAGERSARFGRRRWPVPWAATPTSLTGQRATGELGRWCAAILTGTDQLATRRGHRSGHGWPPGPAIPRRAPRPLGGHRRSPWAAPRVRHPPRPGLGPDTRHDRAPPAGSLLPPVGPDADSYGGGRRRPRTRRRGECRRARANRAW